MSARTHVFTLLGLLGLTALSFGLAQLALGPWELPAALLIAVVKATLVALFFMHLAEQSAVSRAAILTAAAFVIILVVFAVADVRTRDAPALVPPPSARLLQP